MKRLSSSAAVALALSPRPARAFAQHAEKCEPIPKEEWKPQAELERKLDQPGLEDQPGQDHQRLLRGLRPRREEQQGRDLLPSQDVRGRHRAEVSATRAGSGIRAVRVAALVARRRRRRSAGRRPRWLGGWHQPVGYAALAIVARAHRLGLRPGRATRASRSSCAARARRWRYARLACSPARAAPPRPQPARRLDGARPVRLRRRPGADRLALHDRPLLGRRDGRARPSRARLDGARAGRSCTSPASIVASVGHRENLVAAMFDGSKRDSRRRARRSHER